MFTSNWQPPFLNQQKGENDHSNDFVLNHHESFQLVTPGSAVTYTSNYTMEPEKQVGLGPVGQN